MARTSRKFISLTGIYTGGYTSGTLEPIRIGQTMKEDQFQFTRGIIQIHIDAGNVELQLRLHPNAPWLGVKTFAESAMYELVLANYIRIIVEDSARCWLGEIR